MQAEKIMCDCGHIESDHSDITRGYGRDKDGKTFCYDCCEAQDKQAMKTQDKFFAYLSMDGATLVNWPGRKLGTVIRSGAYHPCSRERYYITVRDVHGQMWHGTGAPGEWASLQKNKVQKGA